MFRPILQQPSPMQSPPLPVRQLQQQQQQQQQQWAQHQAQQHQVQQQQMQAHQQALQQQHQQMQQHQQQLQLQSQQHHMEYNDDNNCIICYEDMAPSDSIALDCRHRFHSHVSIGYPLSSYLYVHVHLCMLGVFSLIVPLSLFLYMHACLSCFLFSFLSLVFHSSLVYSFMAKGTENMPNMS